MTNYKFNKKLKALSLLEVIIVLGIVSMTMVSAMAVVLRANSLIKSNEVQDSANDILFQTFELLRSPDPVKVLESGFVQLSQAGLTSTYSIKFDSNRNGYLAISSQNASTQCTNSSEFNVESINNTRPYPVCIRINITPVGSSGVISRYNIVIILSYTSTSAGDVSETYNLIRYERFEKIS